MGRKNTILTPKRTRCYFWGFMSVPILVKIDQVMRPWECPQTDTLTHWQRQTGFVICPMLYAIAMGHNYNKAVTNVIY